MNDINFLYSLIKPASIINYYSFLIINSSVGIALSYGLDVGVLGFDYWWGLGIFIFTAASTTVLGPQPPTQWARGSLSSG
jgi:hypothetical protein